MVTSHPSGHLLVLIACFSLLSLPSDGATVYGLPRQLDYDTQLEEDPVQEGGVIWGGATTRPGGHSILRGNSIASSSHSSSNSNSITRDLGRPPQQSYLPERYVLFSPEENFLRELLLHSAAAPDLRADHRAEGDLAAFASPQDMHRLQQKLPSLDPARVDDWAQQQQFQLYLKQKRLSQLPQMQPQQRYLPDGGLKVAEKRWWGGNRRRGQKDRRASQNKHYDCLKSCIKEGQLHPIQCHTLC